MLYCLKNKFLFLSFPLRKIEKDILKNCIGKFVHWNKCRILNWYCMLNILLMQMICRSLYGDFVITLILKEITYYITTAWGLMAPGKQKSSTTFTVTGQILLLLMRQL